MKTKLVLLVSFFSMIVLYNALTNRKTAFHGEFRKGHPSTSFGISATYAYPPAVGILSNSRNCLTCHVNNGQWKDDENTFIDILDKETQRSLRQADGTFLIETKRYEPKTVFTVIGRKKDKKIAAPYRNAWLYIDSSTIGTHSLSKFAPGWDVNLPMSCRIVGDQLPGYENADITSLPMTVQPLTYAADATLQLQVMMTAGESVKANTKQGMLGNYFERKVILKVR
jgi:hypothetical protein